MKIAVLSGKGGAGKTFVSVNLAVTAGKATYVDCDVEEPNGRLFLKPSAVGETDVTVMNPEFDPNQCIGCRKCVDFCRFHALAFVGGAPRVFTEVCHACGGCLLVCPVGAVTENHRPVGRLECGQSGDTRVVTGVMNLGEVSAVSVIRAALHEGARGDEPDRLTVVDCPPGSGCSVMESVSASDYCVLVVEPTAFGLHNFRMVHELARLMGKPCGVVINKTDGAYAPLEAYCEKNGLPVLCRIPYRESYAGLGAAADIACASDPEAKALFRSLFQSILREAAR